LRDAFETAAAATPATAADIAANDADVCAWGLSVVGEGFRQGF